MAVAAERADAPTIREWRRRVQVGSLLGPPLLVLLASLVTFWWVNTRELGTLEGRTLTLDNLISLTIDHLAISLTATILVLSTAVPAGILLTRTAGRPLQSLVGTAANVGQAATAFGMMVLFRLALDTTGRTAAIAGMTVYSFLPVLRGTITALEQVDDQVLKAARGVGMTPRQLLWRVELPLAVPVLLAGVRIALVLTVATTTIAALVQGGGLGLLIVRGVAAARTTLVVVGFVSTAGIAILADWVGQLAEDFLRPRGLR